jgi:hypothetical protein
VVAAPGLPRPRQHRKWMAVAAAAAAAEGVTASSCSCVAGSSARAVNARQQNVHQAAAGEARQQQHCWLHADSAQEGVGWQCQGRQGQGLAKQVPEHCERWTLLRGPQRQLSKAAAAAGTAAAGSIEAAARLLVADASRLPGPQLRQLGKAAAATATAAARLIEAAAALLAAALGHARRRSAKQPV